MSPGQGEWEPIIVEGLTFVFYPKAVEGFDKLSPNGSWVTRAHAGDYFRL